MSANFHTALPDPVALTTANLESPLAELDQAITNLTTGADDFSQLNLGAFNAKTISGGAITGDKTLVTVDTEASAASDDLDTISSPTSGDLMILKIANAARTVTIRNNGGGSGNIRTIDAMNIVLNNVNQLATLVYNGSNWNVLPNNISHTAFPSRAVTISSDSIAYTSSYIILDTEASASSDNLSTITGGVDGAILFIKTANNARDVVITSSIGNIKTPNGLSFTIDSIDKIVMLVYDATTTTWNLNLSTIGLSSIDSTFANINNLKVSNNIVLQSSLIHPLASTTQPYLDLLPQGGMRQIRVLSAADTTLEGFGFGTLTVSGTPTNNFAGSFVNTGSLVRFASGGSSGNLGGVISPFTLTSLANKPYFRIVFATYSSILVARMWVGLSSAAIGNTDSPSSAGTSFIGVRYSTVVPDSNWQFVTSDGSTTNVTTTGYSANINATYELIMYINNSGSVVMGFQPIGGGFSQLTTSTNIPATATPLGLNARIETREAVAKSFQISGVALYH